MVAIELLSHTSRPQYGCLLLMSVRACVKERQYVTALLFLVQFALRIWLTLSLLLSVMGSMILIIYCIELIIFLFILKASERT